MNSPETIMMRKVKQHFDTTEVTDPEKTTVSELERWNFPFATGQTIGIAVGSRGVHAIDRITGAVVEYVKTRGAHPVIIPAMGSHGGATPEGQKALLAEYGITEERMGAPVDASMEVRKIGELENGTAVVMSQSAVATRGVIVINRIKPHTSFHGMYESGLVKMCVIGLGKHSQALEMHRFGSRGLRELIPEAAKQMLKTGKIIAGVAIIENAVDRPMHIEVIPGEHIMKREPVLLKMAVAAMPRLPIDDIDLLIVDQIGKDFSGTGLDTNIIGRMYIHGEPEPDKPSIKSIMICDISEKSHGNALGIGFAEVITRRLFDKINFQAMYENAFTSTFLKRAKIPIIAETDKQGIAFALRGCRGIPAGRERIVRIRNTLEIGEMYVSDSVFNEMEGRKDISVLYKPIPLCSGMDINPF